MSLGYVPHLRPGALLFTAIAWRHLLNGRAHQSSSVEDVYGHIGGRKRNIFGERVAYASRALFAGVVSPRDVLTSHTLFGVYSVALSHQLSEAWAKSLINGDRRYSGHPRQLGRIQYVTAGLQSCRTCFVRDMDEHGFPSWYVLHVLPPIHHCPYHGDLLITEIKGRVGRNMWEPRLPRGVPADGTTPRVIKVSDGYADYLRYWQYLFERRLAVLDGESWASLMDVVVDRIGSHQDAVREISTQITQLWQAPPEHIPLILGNHVQNDFVFKELHHQAVPSRVAQRLVMLTACARLGFYSLPQSSLEQLNMSLQPTSVEGSPKTKEWIIRQELIKAGYPLAMAGGLAAGEPIARVAALAGCSRNPVRSAIAVFSTPILEELRQLESWADNSWLAHELKKRSVHP